MRQVATAPSRIGEHQYKAFIDRVSHSMVFTLHSSLACGPSVGTAVVVQFESKIYIVSALHNFTVQGDGSPEIIRTWNETRFKFRDAAVLTFREDLNVPEADLHLVLGIQLSAERPPLIDRRFDIIAVRLRSGELLSDSVHAFNLDKDLYTREIPAGASLITIGMPYAGGITLKTGATVFYPHTDHVRYDPNIDTSRLPSSYSPGDHFLYGYSNHLDGIDPGGYSGAPVWSNYDSETNVIWSPNPVIVGIALTYYKKRKLIQAVKILHVLKLFEADRSAATALRSDIA